MPGSRKGHGTMEADKKVSHDELPVNCNDMYDAQHVKFDVHASPLSDSKGLRLPKFEPRYFDGNPADYPQFIKEFEVMLSGFVLNDEMKLMYLLRYCTGVAARAIQCCKFMPPNEGYTEAMKILRQRFGKPYMISRSIFETVKGNGSQLNDNAEELAEFLDNLMVYRNTLMSFNCVDELNSSSVLETVAKRLPVRLQRKFIKVCSRLEEEGLEPRLDDIVSLLKDSVNQALSKFASILHPSPGIEKSESEMQSFMTKGSQRSGYRESCMVSSKPNDCDSFSETSPTDKLQAARQTRLCFVRLQEVHTKANCEATSKFSCKLNVKSASSCSDSELCNANGAVKKPVVVTGNPLLKRVSQTTPQFVHKNRVTVSVSSSDSTSVQGITSQSKGIKPLKIHEEERESSTAVIKEFENDEVYHTDGGKVGICDNGHDSSHLSLADHDEISGMPTTTELNEGSVQLESEVELKTDAVAADMDTREAVSVNDSRVVNLLTDVNAELEPIMKDGSDGNPVVRQPPKGLTTTASDTPLSSLTGVSQSSLVLSYAVKEPSMNQRVLCSDYASVGPFEGTKVNGQFSDDKPTVYRVVTVRLTCTNKGISGFKLLFECYYLWCKLLCTFAWLVRYVVCLLVIYLPRYNVMGVLPFRVEDIDDGRRSANELNDDFPT
ncbi:unnamed protein product [Trichobilharzia szidati]|nr:unnamed protein product [Trichobilharzia szidati]